MSDALRLATRGSALARRQAETVRRALQRRNHAVEVVTVETRGDKLDDRLITELGKTGAFVRAVDRRVMDGDCDLAVHSLKDVPTDVPAELVVAGVPERAPAGDLLVRPAGVAREADGRVRPIHEGGNPVDALPTGATVGTSSLRRRAQLLAHRPDLSVEPLRGNVDTRIEKLVAPGLQRAHERRLAAAGELASMGDEEEEEAGFAGADTDHGSDEEFDRSPDEWFADLPELARSAIGRDVETAYDAIVLAEAGLSRADLCHHPTIAADRLPRETFVPAPGQGALAVTATDPDVVETIRSALDHPPTRITVTVERTVLGELGGGCVAPIGVHALLQGEYVSTRVRVSSREGDREVEATRDLPAERHAAAAREFAADLRERGAAELIEEARRDDPDAAKRVEGGS